MQEGSQRADEARAIFRLDIPLREPFSTASGVVVSRSVALVRVGDEPFGWGEAAPFPGQDESMEELLGSAQSGEWTPTLEAAIDEARADRRARVAGESLVDTIGATIETLPVSLAVGLSDPVEAVGRAVQRGVGRFKLKIEPGRVGHVAAIRSAHPDVLLGVDANGSFDSGTLRELEVLNNLDVAYLEQPVADFASQAARRVREMLDIPVFADESVRSANDAERLLSTELVDGVVLKPGRLGWTGALAVRALATEASRFWRVSGLLETGIGRAYSDILAACPDAFVSDVAPAEWFLARDVTDSRLRGGSIRVPNGPGLGVEPHQLPPPLHSGVSQQNTIR